MAAKFEIREFLTANRDEVIAKYNKLTEERFFNGISLRDFMLQVLHIMTINGFKSEKAARNGMSSLLSRVYCDNCSISTPNSKDDALRAQYKGTAYMAMV
jgi:hypothetical protein